MWNKDKGNVIQMHSELQKVWQTGASIGCSASVWLVACGNKNGKKSKDHRIEKRVLPWTGGALSHRRRLCRSLRAVTGRRWIYFWGERKNAEAFLSLGLDRYLSKRKCHRFRFHVHALEQTGWTDYRMLYGRHTPCHLWCPGDWGGCFIDDVF